MRIAFYEDAEAEDFGPLVHLRAVFELVCGRTSQFERLRSRLHDVEWGAFVRPHLADSLREMYPDLVVNRTDWLALGPTLLVNGRWLANPESLAAVRPTEVGLAGETVVLLPVDAVEGERLAGGRWADELTQIVSCRVPVELDGVLLARPWDLVEENPRQLERDAAADDRVTPGVPVEVIGPRERVSIDDDAVVEPCVVLDVRRGPVRVEAGAVLQSFTRVEGPSFVGAGSRLLRAEIHAGTTIGPNCRVGGEVEQSILHGHVNKYHDGFLGHAYVCPWVNLGAGTTNSDLRNDYGPVRVPLAGDPVETGLTKVGTFVGDHAKTAIGTLFNTGTSIGVAATVVPYSGLVPRFVPSFTSLLRGELVENRDLDGVVATARTAAGRRGRVLGPAAEELLRATFDRTRLVRLRALRRKPGRPSPSTTAGRAG